MHWTKKISNLFHKKDVGMATGGFELLTRLTAGSWNKTKMLETYEKSLYVFACVSKIAEKGASTEFQLFQIMNSVGDIKEIYNHPALDLIYRVNPFQTKSEFLKITLINRLLCGDAFWYKVRNNSGKVVELWNLRPDFMEIVKDKEEFIKGYFFTKTDGTRVFFDNTEIVHFKKPTPLDEYYGISPIRSAQVRIDTEEYASNYQRDFFLNNARPDAILKIDGELGEDEKAEAKDFFERKHRGVGNNSKVAILQGGVEYQQIAVTQKEMDYIESMRFTRDDILVAFGTPKPIVAITDDVNLANAETAMRVYLSETIKPEVDSLCEKINEMLIYPDFGENLFLDFPDPTPENREQTLRDYKAGLGEGTGIPYLTINEVRLMENREPIDGGDQLYMGFSLQPIGTPAQDSVQKMRDAFIQKQIDKSLSKKMSVFRGKEILRQKFVIVETYKKELEKIKKNKATSKNIKIEKVPTALIVGDELREKYIDIILKGIDNRAKKFRNDVTKKAQEQGNALIAELKKIENFEKGMNKTKTKAIGKKTSKTIKDFYKGETEVWAAFAFPFIEEFAKEAGDEAMNLVAPKKEFKITKAIKEALQKRANEFGLGVNETTRDRITLAIDKGLEAGEGMAEISERINTIYEEFPTWRSDLIARTESTASTNEGQMEAYKQSETATHKEWVATLDDRTRDEHAMMNGEIVPVNKNFSNGLMYPSEPNCRCVIAPAFEK